MYSYTPTILAVDDEPDLEILLRQKFRKQLRNNEMILHFAENGVQALQKISEIPDISVVLTDINMPEMDGLTLLEELGKLNRTDLKAVIVSAYGDMGNIRTAMNRGAFDFLTKPIDFGDMDATLQKTIKQVLELRNARQIELAYESVKIDLESASRIQHALLPQKPFESESFSITGKMEPAKEVGGDFFDYFPLSETKTGIVIADVSGKGVPAAIYMAVARTMLRAVAKTSMNPATCLSQLNSLLIRENNLSSFVTVFYGVYDSETKQMEYANGGHNLPFIVRSTGAVEEVSNTEGTIVGKFRKATFESKWIDLNLGDSLFLFTDGVTEAMNVNQDLFEEFRLIDLLKLWPTLDSCLHKINFIFDHVYAFSSGTIQSDDITGVILTVN